MLNFIIYYCEIFSGWLALISTSLLVSYISSGTICQLFV